MNKENHKIETVVSGYAMSEDVILRSKVHWWVNEDMDKLRTVSLANLRSLKIKLKEPINVFIEKKSSEIIINCLDLDLYGVGDTDQEAIKDLSESIEELYFILKKEGNSRLGPHMLNIWNFMKDRFIETNAVKSKRGRKSL